MKHSSAGHPRRLTDDQVVMLRAWKPLWQLCREINVSVRFAQQLRAGYAHKQANPEVTA